MILTSSIKQVFKDEVLQICIDSSTTLLRLTWLQHPNSEEYRRGYQRAIKFALDNKSIYWLTDSRKVHYLPLADQHWMYAKMFPFLRGGKILKFAIVMEPETFLTTDKEPISVFTNQPVKLAEMDLFLEIPSALAWLFENGKSF